MPDPLPELLSGPRLVLRRWTRDDVGVLGAAVERNVDHLRPWMSWAADEPLDPRRRLALLEEWETSWSRGDDVTMAIELDGRVVGGTGLSRRPGTRRLEIGYWVDRDHLRRGIASEAAAVLTGAAFARPGTDRVEIHHDKANVASSGVPLRLGYRFAGESPDTIGAPAETGVDCAWHMDRGRWARLQSAVPTIRTR